MLNLIEAFSFKARLGAGPPSTPLHSIAFLQRLAASFSMTFDMPFWKTLMISRFKLE